jgi:hypothetical protein
MSARPHLEAGRAPPLRGIEVEEVENIEVHPIRDYPDPFPFENGEDPLATARGICNGVALSVIIIAAALALIALITGALGVAP